MSSVEEFLDVLVEAERARQDKIATISKLKLAGQAKQYDPAFLDLWVDKVTDKVREIREESRELALLKEAINLAIQDKKTVPLIGGEIVTDLHELIRRFEAKTGARLPEIENRQLEIVPLEEATLMEKAFWAYKLNQLMSTELKTKLEAIDKLTQASTPITASAKAKAMSELILSLLGLAEKFMLAGGRNVTNDIVKQYPDKYTYGREPSPGACGFCLMLATRGAVYSKKTVLARKNKTTDSGYNGNTYHRSCKCTAYAVNRKKPVYTARQLKIQQLWEEKAKDKKLTGSNDRERFYNFAKDLDWSKL